MKKLALLAIWLALPLVACKSVNAPLPAWAPTAPIAVAGETIASAHAAVAKYEADVQAGFVPSPVLRAVMGDIQQALSVAQPVFNQWEAAARTNAAAPEPVTLPAQLTRISTDIAKLPSTAGN